MLHEKELAGDAVRITFHHHGAIDEMGQQHRRHVGVVLEKVALGDAQFRPEDLLQIGQLDPMAIEVKLNFLAIGGNDQRRRAGACGFPWRLRRTPQDRRMI